MSKLFLGTTVTRKDEDSEGFKVDVLVYFNVDSYSPGYPATRIDPACGPEYEFSFVRAEIDGCDDEGAGGPLTETEIAGLRAWFENSHDAATEEAESNADDGPDPDDERDRQYDRERNFA